MLSRLLTSRVVMIVDKEGGVSRLLTIDASGVTESCGADMSAVAGELAASNPDLILVNREAMSASDETLVDQLNRLTPFRLGYAWSQAPGELPA